MNLTDIIEAGKTCEDCQYCVITIWKSWQCAKNCKIEDLVPCPEFQEVEEFGNATKCGARRDW